MSILRRLEGGHVPGVDLDRGDDVRRIDRADRPLVGGELDEGEVAPGTAVLLEGNDDLDVEPDLPPGALPEIADGIDDEDLPGG